MPAPTFQHRLLYYPYQLMCTFDGHLVRIEQAETAGWTLGLVLPMDPSNPEVGKCPVCKRYSLKVTEAPEPPPPQQPVGWDKIPTE